MANDGPASMVSSCVNPTPADKLWLLVKVILSPAVIDAELLDPGGSLKIMSGISGPAVVNVWLPSEMMPRIIPSGL